MGELGTRLREAREARGLTVEDAERDTRISRRYLLALEEEKFEAIPAPVYARGFLRSYSQYLGLDPLEMLAFFPQEGGPDVPLATGTLKPSRDAPLPPLSPSRPTWNRPGPGSRQPADPRPAARFPGSRPQAAPGIPAQAEEPTIGVDIGLPVPARRLERDSAAATRAAIILTLAAIAIALIVGIAWLIARSDGGSEGGDAAEGDSGAPTSTAESTASVAPAVQRGIVPDVIGLPEEQATALLEAAGYTVTVSREKSATAARGYVVDESPAPSSQLSEGEEVRIVVSDGP